ncbi:hypothetical protein RJ640_024620 [Escallonia rubra]|uniref:Uncharacterized protein n=1 Tax=Escallonia rubra TaxID=112253 RepID=A0AA88RNC5_9ASTE|nr:hypothetical protein RJ640_024620 [Escallonia rubra]
MASYDSGEFEILMQRLLKGGPKSNKGWHSRQFFVGHLDKSELPFDRDWNPYCKDFENPGKLSPNNLTKRILSHIKLRGGLFIDEPLSEQQLEWAKIIPRKPIPAGFSIPPPPHVAPSASSTETDSFFLAKMASESGKSPQGGFLGLLQKAKGKGKEKQPSVELPPVPKKIVEGVSIDEDPIFRARWTLRRDDIRMSDSQISEQHLLHGVLPRDKEMYVSGSTMLSRFEMARQVAADEAQQKRDAIKEADEATRRAEELSKQEADYLAQIETLERRLEWAKRKIAEEAKKVEKAQDQGIHDFFDGNVGDEWLKKRTDDGLEIYELDFAKAKEMFAERFPDIPLDDFVLPAVVSPSGKTVMPSKAGDAAASHPPGEVSGPTSYGFELCFMVDAPTALTAESSIEQKGAYEKWERSNRISQMIMKGSITTAIRGAIPESDNAKIYLAHIEGQFQGSSKAHAITLITKMVMLKYSGFSGVLEHILRMNDMASQLEGLDMEISEGFLVYFIMTSLPAQFGHFKINYVTQKEKWKMSELISMCVQEEEMLKSEQPDDAHVAITRPPKGK